MVDKGHFIVFFRCGLSLPDDTVLYWNSNNVATLNPTTNGCHLK